MLWLKALHLISMVCWFSGLFYLPRLFVYHCEVKPDEVTAYDRFCKMERRLYWGITTPSGVLTIFFGVGLVHAFHYQWSALPHWLMAKLVLVATLIIFHLYCGKWVKKFKLRQNPHGTTFYRWLNEYPVLVLVGAILLAVLKPH